MGAFSQAKNVLIPNDEAPEEAAAFRKQWGWEPHEQVLMRGAVTAGIQEKAGNLGDQQGTASLVTLEAMIISWTFVDDAGHPVAVSLDTIRRLPPEYLTPLSLECAKLQQKGMNEEMQQRFLAALNGHSPVKV